MEPDKFEKYIKEALTEREIVPSDGAWKKIVGQMPKQEPKKTKTFFWYSIAAAFIGVLIVSTLYFNRTDDVVDTSIQVVETPNEQKNTNESNLPVQEEGNEAIVNVNFEESTTDNVLEKDKTTILTDNKYKIASVVFDPIEVMKEVPLKDKKEQLFETKIAEVVAQVNLLESYNPNLTNMEVDSLLRKAQKEILADKIFDQGGNVDAMALLNEVEGELDQTFKEQIFETLKEGFLKVRTAVADRNN